MQRRAEKVDLCEINYLGSSLIDFCISTGKHSWLSPKRVPVFKLSFKAGPVMEKAKAAFIIHQLAMTRGILFYKG